MVYLRLVWDQFWRWVDGIGRIQTLILLLVSLGGSAIVNRAVNFWAPVQGVYLWIITILTFALFLCGLAIAADKLSPSTAKHKETESLRVYVEDFQYGVRMFWLDKTFLFLKCRIVSPLKTTSITEIRPTVFSQGGDRWPGSLMKDLSEWNFAPNKGSDIDMESLSLWNKLKGSPLQKEVQETGWFGIVLDIPLKKEQLSAVRKVELLIEDGGGQKHRLSLQSPSEPKNLIVAKHLR